MISFTQLKVFRFVATAIMLSAVTTVFSQTAVDIPKQPSVQWRFKIKQPIFSSPIASEGVVYFAGFDSTVYAVDIMTGAEKWKLKTNGEIRSNLVLHNNQLFLAGGNGVLSCINKTTGKPVWRIIFDNTALFLGERRYDFADYYHSSPVIYNNVIFLGSGNGLMQAYKVENGDLLWSFKAGDIIHNTAVVVKEKLCFGSLDGHVYALNVRDGSLAWKFKSAGHQFFPKGEFNFSPAANQNTIFIGGRDYNTYAINVNGGYANWNRAFLAWAPSQTIIRDTLLITGTSDDKVLAATDARNGREYWRINSQFNVFGGCAVSPTMVYAPTIWGRLLAVDAKTGAVKWTFQTDGFVANHDKYFKANDTYRDDIQTIFRAPIDFIAAEYKMGGIFSTPLLVGDRLIVTSSEGTVYCLK